MIPLSWFLFAWIGGAGLFCLLALLTLLMHLRYGISGFMTYMSVLLFVGVSVLVFWIVAAYALTVDWTQSLDVTPWFSRWFNLP